MATLEAEPQYKQGVEPFAEDGLITPVDYRVLEFQLLKALKEDPDAADEIVNNLAKLSADSPEQAISTYAYLAKSRDPGIIDIVCDQSARLLGGTERLAPEQIQRLRDIWQELLHPVDAHGVREGDERAYIPQETYQLARGSFDEESRRQLDPQIWSEFREPALPYLEMREYTWAETQRQVVELERRGRVQKQLAQEHAIEFMKKMM